MDTDLPSCQIPCSLGGSRLVPFCYAIFFLLHTTALAEVCKGSKVPKAELRRDDASATLSQREMKVALATHFPWGQPDAAFDAYLALHTVSVLEVEHLTGLDLLLRLDAEDLKKAVASELWPRN